MFKIGLVQTIVMIASSPNATAAIKYDKEAETAALERNRAQWSTYSGGTSNYEFKIERICFCPIEYRGPFNLEVRLGQIVSATYESGKSPDFDVVQGLPTIEGIFGQIEKALDQEYEDLKVTYDEKGGFPTSFWYDTSSMIADDEMTFRVSNVQLLPSLDL